MFDWDDDLPPVKTSLREELVNGASMVRSVLKLSMAVGVAVGAATALTAIAIEKGRRI